MVDIEVLRQSNLKLGLTNHIKTAKDRNVIFVYCPPKVGSTSLVSSIRISCSHLLTILHIHAENMLEMLCGIKNVTVHDMIQYNRSLGRNVTVIDIYRTPIEHKISDFFENIVYHFNNTEKNINNYNVNKLINRFNQLFPHLTNTDYYKSIYGLDDIPQFDYNKKYIMTEKNGVKYIKIRLQDSLSNWCYILKETLGINVHVVKDHLTEKKEISNVFKQFKQQYRIPANHLEHIKNSESFLYYLTKEEQDKYISGWKNKSTFSFTAFAKSEYELYSKLCSDNKVIGLAPRVQTRHYIDEGCCCNRCSSMRYNLLNKIRIQGPNCITESDKVIHITQHYRRIQQPSSVSNKLRNGFSKYSFSTKFLGPALKK